MLCLLLDHVHTGSSPWVGEPCTRSRYFQHRGRGRGHRRVTGAIAEHRPFGSGKVPAEPTSFEAQSGKCPLPVEWIGVPGACGAPTGAVDRHIGSCWNLGLQGRISALEEYWKLRLDSRAAIETSHSLNPFGWSSGTSRHDLIKRGLLNRRGFSACCAPVTSRLGDSSGKLPCQSYSTSSDSG